MIQEFINRVASKINPQPTFEDKLKAQTVISSKMLNAIKLWTEMYTDMPPWKGEKGLETKTQNIPAAIAREFARLITQESEISVGGDERGAYINEQLQRFLRYFPQKVEMYCAKGGIFIKPYISGKNVILSYYTADRAYPTAYDTNGDISGAVFIEQMRKGGYIYTRLEWHTMTYNADIEDQAQNEDSKTADSDSSGETPKNTNLYNVRNQAFRSERLVSYSDDSDFDMMNCRFPLQDEVDLNTIDEWSDIEPEVNIVGLEAPLFVYIKVPSANNVDSYCPLGVSVYSLAIDAIRESDRQYTRCINEYELKEAAIHASADLWKSNKDGTPILPEGKERVYRTLDDAGKDENTIKDYSPDIRDTSFYNGLEETKRDIEFLAGLAYGTLSRMQETAKTATEIKMSKQRSYTTVSNMQREIEDGLRKVCDVINALADLYELCPDGSYELACAWGDSVREDTDVEYQRRLQLVMAGLYRQEAFVAWYFGCPEEEVVKKYMPLLPAADDGNHDEGDKDGGA